MRCPVCNLIISEHDIKHCKRHDMTLVEWRKLIGVKQNLLFGKSFEDSTTKPYTAGNKNYKRGESV